MITKITQESKRRRVSNLSGGGGGGGGYAGSTLGELLVHLASRAPQVRVMALDALGAPLAERGPALDEAAEALTCTVEGAFVARVEGLVGSSLGDLDGIEEADVEALGGDEKTIITVVPCDVAAAAASADAADGSREGGAAPPRKASRAHELLTRRAREVFDAAMAASSERRRGGVGGEAAGAEGGERVRGGAGGTGDGIASSPQQQQLRALEALVLWLDAHHDIFTVGDPSNDGRILAPDPAAGGCLVPARLLHA